MKAQLETPQEVLDYRHITRALHWLEGQQGRQPKVSELASALDTTPSHLSRLFARWAGVPPKRFLGYLTKEHAKALLRAGESAFDSATEVGLSSTSRLHDLLVTADAVTPGEYKRRGHGIQVRWGVHASPFGDCFVATTERGVLAMSFLSDAGTEAELRAVAAELPEAGLRRDDGAAHDVVSRAFSTPERPNAPLSVWLRGTPFQLKVWEAVLSISPGSVSSYGRIASRIGAPKAARAVGSALGANRVAVLVPCHRVIRAVGDASAYRWGHDRKRLLLAWESARRA